MEGAKMASFLFPFPATINHRRRSNLTAPSIHNFTTANRTALSVPVDSYKFNLHRSFHFIGSYWCGRCRAASSPPDPPSEKHRASSSGVMATFTRFKDTLQVFFAVLFWMSLFFWSSAWDGGNSGRPNKRPRIRK